MGDSGDEGNNGVGGSHDNPQPQATTTVDEVIQTTVRAILLHNNSRSSEVKNSEISALLTEFKGFDDDVEQFIRRVDTVKSAYNVTDRIIMLAVASKLSGHAKVWFHSKVEFITMTWQEFKSELVTMFGSRPSKLTLMKNFELRKWRKNEKFTSYCTDKVALGNLTGLSDADIIDYVIDGFNNSALQSQARMREFTTLSDLIRVMKNLTDDDRSSSSAPVVRPFHQPVKVPNTVPMSTDPQRRQSNTSTLRCFNCNLPGHRVAECSKPKRPPGSCFKCGKMGHRAKDCPETSTNPSAFSQSAPDSTTHVIEEPFELVPAMMYPIAFRMQPESDSKMKLDAFLDGGSPISLIRCDIVPKELIEPLHTHIPFTGINNSRIDIIGELNRTIMINTVELPVKFFVVSVNTIRHVCLLGRDVICSKKFKLTITDVAEIEPVHSEIIDNDILSIDIARDGDELEQILDINENLSYDLKKRIHDDLVANYVLPKRPEEPVTDLKMKIPVKKNHAPFFYRPRRLSYADKIEVEKICNDLQERHIIEKSDSMYSSPIVLVKNKDRSRMCVDYRDLNKITERDNYPLPLIDDQIDCLRDKKYFSRLDLKDAFHHVVIEQESVKYTSFVTPVGQFQYRKMPFGLKNSPSMFMRFVNTAFKRLLEERKVVIYVDDILVATETVEENINILKEVYDVLVQNVLELKIQKCSFVKTEITYLGYDVSENGIKPCKENINSILSFPLPTNYKMLHSFIGLASYFRRFIFQFAILAKPLYDILKLEKTNKCFEFSSEAFTSFERIKAILVDGPVLCIYSPHLETQLHCDASSVGFGAILVQKQTDGHFHPVFYFSKRTTPSESKLHSFELEALSIVHALERLKVYLQGIRFKIVTDCNSLKLTLQKKEVNPRILRWSLVFQNFDYELEHRKSENMRHVDALSRCISVITENSFEQNLAILQNNDATIVKIRDALEETESPLYELRDGLVYRKSGDKLLFYVPESMINNVIRTCHDDIGHLGINKVIDLITRNYWFADMKNTVAKYIQNCLKCIVYSPNYGKGEGFLHPIPKGNVPFDTLHIDHYGPLEKTSARNKHIFAVVDGFTKFIKLFACKSTDTKEVIKHLTSYFNHYSRPNRIVADRGSCFRSNDFKNFLDGMNIQLILIAKNTPRANGQIERFNRDLTPIIAKLAPQPNQWDRVLDQTEYAINNTINRSSGKAPSVLLFGIRQKGRVHDALQEYLESLNDDNIDLNQIRADAETKIENEQNRNKLYYDAKHKQPKRYEIGDYIMCKNIDVTPGVNKKHLPKYKGPYEVVKVLPHDRYAVQDVPGFQVTQIPYHGVLAASDMRPFVKEM